MGILVGIREHHGILHQKRESQEDHAVDRIVNTRKQAAHCGVNGGVR